MYEHVEVNRSRVLMVIMQSLKDVAETMIGEKKKAHEHTHEHTHGHTHARTHARAAIVMPLRHVLTQRWCCLWKPRRASHLLVGCSFGVTAQH